MNNHIEEMISIPISAKFRETALKFAQEQPTQSKAKQVYLNTLAVQVVYSYLEMLDIPASLETSYSWQRVTRLLADIADLHLLGIGHLECRQIRTGSRFCHIPYEVWDDRVGYIIVEIDKTCKEGKIRGFFSKVITLEVDINQLQSLSSFIEYLHQSPGVQLRQWLEGIYATQWQNIELNRSRELAFRERRVRGFELNTSQKVWQVIKKLYPNSTWQNLLPPQLLTEIQLVQDENLDLSHEQIIKILVYLLSTAKDEEIRWTLAEILWTLEPTHPAINTRRIMDLGMHLGGNPIGLMVAILQKPDQTIAVLLRVYPMGNLAHLPSGLELALQDEENQVLSKAQARENKDDYIQLKFCGEFGERFQVCVTVNNTSITENFVI